MNTEKYPKLESYARVDAAKKKAKELFTEAAEQKEAGERFSELKEKIFRDEMLDKRRRPDGRAFDQIRKIDIEVGVLPRVHGSALFTRGETQAMVSTTLGTKDDEQRVENAGSRDYVEALHAALQLPAVLGGRSGPHGFAGSP